MSKNDQSVFLQAYSPYLQHIMAIQAQPFQALLDSIPDFSALPTFDEMNARTQALKALADPAVTVRVLGHSEAGDAIELISIGDGPIKVLLVGAPHPNEPVGCLTIEFLIDHLIRHPGLREAAGCTWHFVKAIEPDALRMNEGWFKRAGDPVAYLQNFYRPALIDQAEYSFPLTLPTYRFDGSTPENLAYQEAIRLAEPDLLYSLHNAEFGGVFYLVTDDVAAMCSELSAQPPMFGLAVDEIGEPSSQGQAFAPGVFEAPNIRKFAAIPGMYSAGQSALDHSRDLHGTLGLMAEIPYWQPKTSGLANEQRSIAEIFAPVTCLIREVEDLLTRHDAVHGLSNSPIEKRLSRAIRESLNFLRLHRDIYTNVPEDRYRPQDAATHGQAVCLLTLRPVSMLARLSEHLLAQGNDALQVRAACEEASDFLAAACRDKAIIGEMEVVPLRSTVAVQVSALLSAAAALKRQA